ncbi:MAG: DUF2188 domain-containing protein [Kiritimatiellae bacterium]|nr:DUF2188 domain-containing protein [Kiritimatiellia bacterium]
MSKDYWVSPAGDGRWKTQRTGAERAASVHSTQAQAWAEAQRLARDAHSEAVLQNRHGQIRARNTYGHDPRDIPG